jgi:NAD(P)-dependent dehydrogenase (short-subunit alcohol dehydrogenase family)
MNKSSQTGNDKQVAVVTGGTQGIGLAIVRRLCEEGLHVAIVDLYTQRAAKPFVALCNEFEHTHFFECDLSNPTSIGNLVEEIVEYSAAEGCSITTLVNNARFRNKSNMLSETVESWDQAIAVGVRAPFLLSRAIAPHMPAGSTITNIGSITSHLIANESPSYHVSKAGLEHLTRYLAVNLGPNKIRVNCALPGFIVQERHRERFSADTNKEFRKNAEAYLPTGEPGLESDIAEIVWFLSSPSSRFISGASIVADGAGSLTDQFTLLMRTGS